jgi:hypothetical protein
MSDTEQRSEPSSFADRSGMIGPYGARYSWLYWAVILAALVLLIIDIVDDSALWNYLVIALVALAILIQPGGVRGPRRAVRTEKQGSRQVASPPS